MIPHNIPMHSKKECLPFGPHNFGRSQRMKGLTLVELISVVAIIVLMINMTMASIRMVKNRAEGMTCSNNLFHIGRALNLYKEENRDTYPFNYFDPITHWQSLVSPYLADKDTPGSILVQVGGVNQSANYVATSYNQANDANWVAGLGYGAQVRLRPKFLCPSVLSFFKPLMDGGYAPWGYGHNECVSRDPYYNTPPLYPHTATIYGPSVSLLSASSYLNPNPEKKIILACNVNGGKWDYGWDLRIDYGGGYGVPYPNSYQMFPPIGFHGGNDNYLYCDGHVEAIDSIYGAKKYNAGWWDHVKLSPWWYVAPSDP